jgi:hypothetical protein
VLLSVGKRPKSVLLGQDLLTVPPEHLLRPLVRADSSLNADQSPVAAG